MGKISVENLQVLANRLRKASLRMTSEAGSGHPTSCMSCAEIISALFFSEMNWDPRDPASRDYDTFVLSKGHAAPILYAALHEAGAIKDVDLLSLRKAGSFLEGHPSVNCPFVRVATGSLGQGLSVACGMALARKKDGIDSLVFCLMGDGELQEGSVWEAANFASHNKLTNLIAIADVNRLGQSAPTMFQHDVDAYAKRFSAFGWQAKIVDGHNVKELISAISAARNKGPFIIIAKTTKGKGVSFLEDEKGVHGKAVPKDQLESALSMINNHSVDVEIKPVKKGASLKRSLIPANLTLPVPYKLGDTVATREAYGYAVKELGKLLKDFYVLDADVKNSTYSEKFEAEFPDRFVQTYIAEQNMAGIALGLAVEGKIPTLSSFACFLTRAYDFFRMAAYSRPANYLVCGSHAGVSIGEDGPSQMGLEDIAMMKSIFNSAVVYPADAVSTVRLIPELLKHNGITYLRATRPKTKVIYSGDEKFTLGGSKTLRQSKNDQATIIAAGITLYEALAAHEQLKAKGINTRVIDMYSIIPIDRETITKAVSETGSIVTCEDHGIRGGLGEEVASVIAHYGRACRFKSLAVENIPGSASPQEQLAIHGIDSKAIVKAVTKLIPS